MNKVLLVFIALLSFSFSAKSQKFGTLEVNNSISSGIIVAIDSTNEVGLVQFEFDNLTDQNIETIYVEFRKYQGYIQDFGIDDNKLIVAYVAPHYPNFLLGILDRVNIRGYYLDNGNANYYFKDGNSAFVR